LLQGPLHPFGDQADRRRRVRRLLMVSDSVSFSWSRRLAAAS
jgi:hypothetical protein